MKRGNTLIFRSMLFAANWKQKLPNVLSNISVWDVLNTKRSTYFVFSISSVNVNVLIKIPHFIYMPTGVYRVYRRSLWARRHRHFTRGY